MNTEDFIYHDGDMTLRGVLAADHPSMQAKRPGILVVHEAWGLGDHAIERAKMLAHIGYVALAADMYGDRRQATDLETAMGLIGDLRGNPLKLRQRAWVGIEALKKHPLVDQTKIAAIGFCFGGTMSYELALSGADIKAAVGFHSGLAVTSPGDAKQIRAKVLALLGADDPGIPPEQRRDFEAMLREGGADWQMTLYGGVVHSFTNPHADRLGRPDFARYDARADARSWKQMTDLFTEVFA